MSVSFDNTDDYIQLRNPASLNITADFSVSAWISMTSSGGAGNLLFRDDGVFDSVIYLVSSSGAGAVLQIYSDFIGGGTSIFSTGLVNQAGTFQQVGFARTGTGVIFYINGVNAGSSSYIGNFSSTSEWWIGGDVYGGSKAMKVTEVAMWNTNIGSAGMATLANGGNIRGAGGIVLTVVNGNLKGYWPLNDFPDGSNGTGRSYPDKSGQGNAGTGNWGTNGSGMVSFVEQGYLTPGMGQWGY